MNKLYLTIGAMLLFGAACLVLSAGDASGQGRPAQAAKGLSKALEKAAPQAQKALTQPVGPDQALMHAPEKAQAKVFAASQKGKGKGKS
jgi:hypothetical protein